MFVMSSFSLSVFLFNKICKKSYTLGGMNNPRDWFQVFFYLEPDDFIFYLNFLYVGVYVVSFKTYLY